MIESMIGCGKLSGRRQVSRVSIKTLAGVTIAGLAMMAGCQPPPPANVPVQAAPPPRTYSLDTPKPLPDQSADEPPPPAFNDPPLIDQQLPEEAWFVDAYNHVGRPRIAVFVNRTLDGGLIQSQDIPISSVDTVQHTTGGVSVQHSEGGGYSDIYGGGGEHQRDSFSSNGPAEYHETTTVYLHPGQYDDADLQGLDYQEMESLLTDWMGCSGHVALIAPDFVRSKLNDQQLGDLQAGKANGLNDVAQATQADILVQFQAHPVRRGGGIVVLLVGEAVNVRDGESISHASVEMPTPIDRYELNNFTRFLARKLIHGMVQTWSSAPPPPPGPGSQGGPPPATQP
jgi:hypothetical protein